MNKGIVVVLLSLLLPSAGGWAVAQISVRRCSTEYLTNPIGIDTREPRLSWTIEGKERGIRQTAYQMLAQVLAPGKGREDGKTGDGERTGKGGKMGEGQADIWNSGKVRSDNSVLVPFAGGPLLSGKRYYWRVRVWDQKGDSSHLCRTGFLQEMGLLARSDWEGPMDQRTQRYMTGNSSNFVAAPKLAIKRRARTRTRMRRLKFRKSFFHVRKRSRPGKTAYCGRGI